MNEAAWWRRHIATVRAWRDRRAMVHARNAHHDRLLQQLPIPLPFEARAFCARLAAQRERPIALVPFALCGKLYGFVASGDAEDYIVYERDTTALHQQQIIAHEACHLILGHYLPVGTEGEMLPLAQLLLGADLVRHVLGRGGPASAAEIEAELLASRIIRHAVALQTAGQILAPGVTEALTRLRPFRPTQDGR